MNLDEIIKDVQKDRSLGKYDLMDIDDVKLAMREAVRRALELAAERAEVVLSMTDNGAPIRKVDKQSILDIIEEIE